MLVFLCSLCDVSESGLLLQVGEGKKKFPVEIESFKLDFHLGGRMVNNCHYKLCFKGSIYDGLFTIMPPKWKLSLRGSISTRHTASGIWQ